MTSAPVAGIDPALHVVHAATHEHTGAGRSAVRIHRAVAKAGLRSELLVLHGDGAEPGVEVLGGPMRSRLADLRQRAENALLSLQASGDGAYRSLGLRGGPGLAAINGRRADVVHLHWIPGLLGITDLPAIARPVVWTFHDQWPICGAEHYTDLARQHTGYEPENRAPGARGLDLDRWVWRRKRASWKAFSPLVVCPSRWLAEEVRASALFGNHDIRVIPYPIDTSLYSPQDRSAARLRMGLPRDRTLLLFAAIRATSDPRKGFGVLAEALRRLSDRGLATGADLVVCGATGEGRVHGFATHWLGQLDEAGMRQPLSACDVLVLPSLQDNLPNVLVEAMSCGLPAVGSDTGGIPDLVRHMETGLLAAVGDAAQLADRLEMLLRDAALRTRLAQSARRAIEDTCDERLIGARYAETYRAAIEARDRPAR